MAADATAWLKEHGVPELFDSLAARVAECRPDDVVAFLIRELEAQSRMTPAAKACLAKMKADGVNALSIRSFLNAHALVAQGETGTIPETAIDPADGLPAFASLPQPPAEAVASLVAQVVVLKLNGGLGTGMGLSQAKSLLTVKNGENFLDFIAKQTLHLREEFKSNVRFMLMNSFSTSADTEAYLRKYDAFAGSRFGSEVEVMQGKVPKISQSTLMPASYPKDPECEWTPPGHGELYIALAASGKLDALLAAGFKYLFVSNSDNLGATLDVAILNYLANSNVDFVMEVCERADADKKGGHLARSKSGGLLLRESAQCRKEDEGDFQNIQKHRYFNTNNLWVNLVTLKQLLVKHDGVLPLPVIRNGKTVDPTDSSTEKVFQLESAMGSAIALFDRPSAVVVPRSRFAPVKTCSDLLSLRSDCYTVTPDHRIVLIPERHGVPPNVTLDDKHYKFVSQFEKLVEVAVPSMKDCAKLTVTGPIRFLAGVVLKGSVTIVNASAERKDVPAGVYTGEVTL